MNCPNNNIIIIPSTFLLVLACLLSVPNSILSNAKHQCVHPDNRTLDEMYKAALAEQAALGNNGNGPLIVYSGGTARGQMDSTARAFEQRFPNLTVNIVVDYSIFQGPRVDVQLANNSLVPDLIQLQTLQDFPEWKRQGVLMQYKPANWSKVYRKFRDEDGYYTATLALVFGTLVNSQRVARDKWPKTARELLEPEFGNGTMVLVHPRMDDAILFYFKQVVDKYGYGYLAQLAAQKPVFVCDGGAHLTMVGNGSAAVGPAGIAVIPFGNDSTVQLAPFPPADNDPFVTYSMYMAIFKQTKRAETAKLFLNWLLETNSVGSIWSVRTDVIPLQGFKPIWEYKNTNHAAFATFMADYKERERFSKQFALFLGETSCDQSPLNSGVNVRN